MKTVTKKTITVTEVKTHKFDNGFICKETWVNGKLADQYFQTPDSKKSHPYTYENRSLNFNYYPDAKPSLESEDTIYETPLGSYKIEPQLINDLESFNDWDNVILHHLGMDGNIYKINSPLPLSIWKHKDYISGFDNLKFDLNKVAEKLKTFDWVKNVEIEMIPYYNQDEGRTCAVEFDYKPPQELIAKLLKNKKGDRKHLTDDFFGSYCVFDGYLDVFGVKKFYKKDKDEY